MIDIAQLEKAWNWRYACKKFDPTKKISGPDWAILQKSLQTAPSSYGLQPYKFILVENPTLRAKLKEVSWNQSQVTDCSHYLVLTSKSRMVEQDIEQFIGLTEKTRNLPAGAMKGYQDMMIGHVVKGLSAEQALSWTRRQVYIAMGFLLETAALMNIDSTPMEGLDGPSYDKILDLESTGYQTVAAVALGYRHTDDSYQHAPKVRRSLEDLIEVR
jgi:nitroreductase